MSKITERELRQLRKLPVRIKGDLSRPNMQHTFEATRFQPLIDRGWVEVRVEATEFRPTTSGMMSYMPVTVYQLTDDGKRILREHTL